MVLAVLLDQHLDFLSLLKRGLHLGYENFFDYPQLLPHLVLLFTSVERVEGLKVFQEHVANVYQSILLVIRLCLSLSTSPFRVKL